MYSSTDTGIVTFSIYLVEGVRHYESHFSFSAYLILHTLGVDSSGMQ